MSDDVLVGTPASTAPRTPDRDVLSPELVLVDPSLRAAWQLRAEAGDEAPQLPVPSASADADAVDRQSAARRLARDALAVEVVDPAPALRRPLTLWLAAAVTALSAAVAIAFLAFGARLGTGELPPAPEPEASGPRASIGGPTPSIPTGPQVPRRTVGARRFTWAPAAGASRYHIELFRGAERVFAADPARPEIVIPAKWTFEGRERRLEAVEYRWYVWPIVSGRRSPDAVVQARLVLRDS